MSCWTTLTLLLVVATAIPTYARECNQDDQFNKVLDARGMMLSPPSSTDYPDFTCETPVVRGAVGDRGVLPTDYFLRVDSIDLDNYPTFAKAQGAVAKGVGFFPSAEGAATAALFEDCPEGQTFSDYIKDASYKCAITVTNTDDELTKQYIDGGGKTQDVWAYIDQEKTSVARIKGIGRIFCFESPDVEWPNAVVRHGPMDFVEIDLIVGMKDIFGSGPDVLYLQPSKGVSGTLTVLCDAEGGSVAADGSTVVSNCGDTIVLGIDAHEADECTLESAGACGDSVTYLRGTISELSDMYDPEEVKDAFKNERKNFMHGWVSVEALCGDEGCSSPTPAPGVYRDISARINESCSPVPGEFVSTSPPPVAGPPGVAEGDPHFVGFNGAAYDYTGLPGECFSVISAPGVAVNACLVPELVNGLTYMGQVGILTPQGTRVQVAANPEDGTVVVEANDVLLAADTDRVYEMADGVRVDFLDAQTVVVVVAGQLDMLLSLHNGKFLDIAGVELLRPVGPGEMHGVLGQSALPDSVDGFVGEEIEYVVRNLWATDFAYSLYEPNGSTVDLHKVEVVQGGRAFINALSQGGLEGRVVNPATAS